MIKDQDTGKIYDTRIDRHVERATMNTPMSSSVYVPSAKKLEPEVKAPRGSIKKNKNDMRRSTASAWGNWWDEKKKVNHDFLRAAENGNLEDFHKYLNNDLMLGKAADVNFTGLHDWTALHYAADNDKPKIVFELLKQPGIKIQPETEIKRTPLHLAALRGSTEIVRALVEKGANPNCKDIDQYTPLHFASENGKINVIMYLVKEAEANPFMKNKFGYFPSDIAFNLEVRKCFDSLLGGSRPDAVPPTDRLNNQQLEDAQSQGNP